VFDVGRARHERRSQREMVQVRGVLREVVMPGAVDEQLAALALEAGQVGDEQKAPLEATEVERRLGHTARGGCSTMRLLSPIRAQERDTPLSGAAAPALAPARSLFISKWRRPVTAWLEW